MRLELMVAVACVVLSGCSEKTAALPEVRIHGALRDVMQGDSSPRVELRAAGIGAQTYGVGALSGLRGEVTILGGEVVLSYPSADGAAEVKLGGDEAATLLAVAEVPRWEELSADTPRGWTQEQLEQRLEAWSGAAAVPAGRAIPVLIEGEFETLRWHVIAPGAHDPTAAPGHGAAGVKLSCTGCTGRVVGFFSTQHEGLLTHHGQKLHLHALVDAPGGAGHVDALKLSPGTKVKVPAR